MKIIRDYWYLLIFILAPLIVVIVSTSCHRYDFDFSHDIESHNFDNKVKQVVSTTTDSINTEKMMGLAEEFKSMLKSKDKQIKEYTEYINQQITWWLSVVAAICTILPIVMELRSAQEIKEAKKRIEEMRDKNKKELNNLIQESIGEYKKKLSELEERHLCTQAMNTLTILRTMCDFPNKQRPAKEESTIILALIKVVKDNIKDITSDKNKSLLTRSEILSIIEQLRALIYTYEVFQDKSPEALEELQSEKYNLTILSDKISSEETYKDFINDFYLRSIATIEAIESLMKKEV